MIKNTYKLDYRRDFKEKRESARENKEPILELTVSQNVLIIIQIDDKKSKLIKKETKKESKKVLIEPPVEIVFDFFKEDEPNAQKVY